MGLRDLLGRRPEPHPYWTPPTVIVGEHTYGRPEVIAFTGGTGRVEIGRYSSIADGVKILTSGGHHVEWVSTFPLREMLELPGAFANHPVGRGPVTIGHDVWIGREALLFDGLTIGHGAVIAARAVVTKDVRPYAIVGGNPEREIRRRFTDDQVDRLLRIAWWDWPHEKIVREVDGLNGATVDEFLTHHG
jgi:acetyltransferase-like isoleucine patch superfamily enzyme